MTEEDVKLKLITPSLQKSGWNIQNQINMEFPVKQNYQFTDGEMAFMGDKVSRKTPKFADYLLTYKNIRLAIVEAKKDDKSYTDGLSQAKDYAKMLNVPFAYASNGDAFMEYDFFTGKNKTLKMSEFPTPDELFMRYINAKNITPDQEKLITYPYYLENREPRYYQQIAIDSVIQAIAKGQKRLLLVMATGTGKTFTAFEIIHRLYKSGKFKKILYLADRNILVDQSIDGDFKPLGKNIDKIQKHKINASEYDIFFGLYQQLAGNDDEDFFTTYYKDIPRDFFDFIIIDECHRGSANEVSAWRKILDYFSLATSLA
ncbi:DEAD/DEAH box helicase family protein [Campylobacter sp. JMF_06 NA1]|uniref:DEAD/DEAH box helicase family protein n=1 Tax=Campylobacter sp. JMF_06 NA1 TaxID=2983823 RepID=UPI0022E9A71C|nr:DEAD/DEAH box helicase family protein [Campylobacter sp. JMF_06 NA1]MDA3077572.1 DEAD/DEAH box helicase family protein [Campylobacter sp. JMF_06 NA1]